MSETEARIVKIQGNTVDTLDIDLTNALAIEFKLRDGVWIQVDVEDGKLHIMGDRKLSVQPITSNVVDIDQL